LPHPADLLLTSSSVVDLCPAKRLKPVAPSMGMMLETTATRLFAGKGQHFTS
jgi:hypothetical protein